MCLPRPCSTVLFLACAALAAPAALAGQVGDVSWVKYPGWQPSDRVEPAITVRTRYDPARQLWRYEYTLANGPTAQQDIIEWELSFNAPVTAIAAPAPWRAVHYRPTIVVDPGAGFFAPLPAENTSPYLWPPSPYQLPPGGSLSGFVLESPYPPGYARSRAWGWAAIPLLPDSLSYDEFPLPPDTLNSRRGWTLGPTRYTTVVTGGNRRPATDGFLGFMNLDESGSILTDPAPIALEFSLHGETVFRQTLHVELNGTDVTAAFLPGPPDGADLVAVFHLGSSPLRPGKNVLVTSVEGLIATTGQRATDTDRITFTVEPLLTDATPSLRNLPR